VKWRLERGKRVKTKDQSFGSIQSELKGSSRSFLAKQIGLPPPSTHSLIIVAIGQARPEEPELQPRQAVADRFRRTGPKAQAFGSDLEKVTQIGFGLPDPVSNLAAVETGKRGTAKLSPGIPLDRRQHLDFVGQSLSVVQATFQSQVATLQSLYP